MPPKRPRQHQLEDESRKALEALVPSRHVYRPEQPDYGRDGELEEFDAANEATGHRFGVQLKATDETGPAAMRERISLETAAYYRAQLHPVLMVRYLASTGRLYGRWFHEFDPHEEHLGEKHLTFHWYEDNELSEASFDRLFGDVERIVRLRAVGASLPLTVGLETPAGGVHGSTPTELEVAFGGAVGRYPGILEPAGASDDADVTVSIGEGELRADVSGLASITLHLESDVYPPDTSPQAIVGDALSCVAVALARARLGDPAARIAVDFFVDSLVSGVPPLGADLAVAMAQSGRVVEAIDLAERLDQDGGEARAVSGAIFMETIRARTGSLQPHEGDRFEAALRARLNRRIDAGQEQSAAAAAENVGTYLMVVRRPWDAVEFLEQAIALDPSRETATTSQRLAGAYFLGQRYVDAVPAYDRALDLAGGADPGLEARRADALLYAGRYRQALDAFREVDTGDDVALSTWVYVKTRALVWVIEATAIEEQDPDRHAANELAGRLVGTQSEDEEDAIAAQIWERDASSPLGWFNRARDLLDRGLEEDAMHAYLVAAVMREGDVEAWVNVALLAGNLDDADLLTASVITGDRLNKGPYMDWFMRHLRETVPDADVREAMLTMVRRAIESAGELTASREVSGSN